MRTRPLLLLLAWSCWLVFAPPAAGGGETIEHEKVVLDNGLKLILHQDHRLPLVAVDVWYHVGAREEPEGRAGFAHLFEHLMFMGTDRVPNGRFDEILEDGGAWSNASTDFDRTDYYVVGPSRLLPTILWLEADRMEGLGAAMTQEKLDLQREVVRNEIRESYDNAPYGPAELRLYQEMFPPGHPYHFNVIGRHEDLARATVDDVKAFFETYYVPNNATLVVAGDFEPDAVKKLVESLFGSLPRRDDPPRRPPVPVVFEGERRVVLPDDVSLARTSLVWHSPPFYAPGDAEMDLVASLLTEGKNGRLYRRLVHDERIATNVAAYQESMRLGSLFRIEVTANPDVSLERLERVVDEVLEELRRDGPHEDELQRARASVETSAVSGLQSLLSVADTLNGYDANLGDPDRLAWDLDRYRTATPESVRDAVRRTLVPGRRLVLRVVPRQAEATTTARDERPPDAAVHGFSPPVPDTFRLENGLTVWHLGRAELPLVSARLLLPVGSSSETPQTSGLAALTAAMLAEGAGDRDALAFGAAMDRLGASFFTDVGRETTTIGVEALARHADEAVGLMAEAVTRPRFDEDGWSRVSARLATAARQQAEDAEALAAHLARIAFFTGRLDAYALPPDGRADTLGRQTLAAARDLHRRRYVPDGAVLLLAGDLDREAARTLAERHFGAWRGPLPETPALPPPVPASGGLRVYLVDRPGAEQTVIHLVLPGVPWPDEDRLALRVAVEALGGSFTSRLNARLREQEGYTYGSYAWPDLYAADGVVEASAPVKTDVTEAALASFLEMIRSTIEGGVTAEETARAVATIRSSTVQSFEDLSGTLTALGSYARYARAPRGLVDDMPRLSAVDAATASAALARNARLEAGVLVLVGDARRVRPALAGLGFAEPVLLTAQEALVPGPLRRDPRR